MKLFKLATLVAAARAACSQEGDDYVCDNDDDVCVYREIVSVDPKNKRYKKDLKNDATLVVGYTRYQCFDENSADAFVSRSGLEDSRNKITWAAKIMDDQYDFKRTRSSATTALIGSSLAAIALIWA